MILGPTLLAARAASLILASTSSPIVCKVDVAPEIKIAVTTNEIDYDYSRDAKTLTQIKTNTKSPFPPGSDTVTGGLREDHPQILTEMQWDVMYEQRSNMGCMRYKTIDINIHLQPRIYLAREFNTGTCRDAVLGHERKHVQVDREVMNKYAGMIGIALQGIINRVGAIGPFDMKDREAVKAQSSGYITDTMDQLEKMMVRELHSRQQEVDSLTEYERVGGFCNGIKVAQ